MIHSDAGAWAREASPRAGGAREVAENAAEALEPELSLLGPVDIEWLTSSFLQIAEGLQRNWMAAAGAVTRYSADVANVALAITTGTAARDERTAEPEPGDKRFRDPEWQDDPYFRGLKQGYLLWARLLDELVNSAALEDTADQRARFATRAVVDAMSPTNFFWTNPAAIRRAIETSGESIAQGLANMAADLEHNGGRPRQVDTTPFRLGHNLAATPGHVVYRNEIMELIQYDAQTEQVHEIPLLVSPPWINKYYILDLSPGRSFIEWAVKHGHTVFAISYRNPDQLLRNHRLDDYLINGPRAALDVVEDITGRRQVNIAALCVGGTLTGMLLAWLAEAGDDRVTSATLLNTLLDFEDAGALAVFTDEDTVERLEQTMSRIGYLDGHVMAGTFDALRANDLIWNYVARNWLMGETPPAFDILAWNADSTRLPHALHTFYLRACYLQNQLARGVMELAGVPLNLASVKQDVFFVAAQNDHIVPWRSAYRGARLLGGDVTFVLTSSGHIAGVVNPPNPKARHWINQSLPSDPDEWFQSARRQPGSWWLTWTDWIDHRAGPLRAPPATGSASYPRLGPAPGKYVHETSSSRKARSERNDMSNEEPYATGSQFLDAWQEMTETATKQTRETVARSQDIIVDAVSAWSRTVQTLIPNSMPADLASQAPKPSDLVESGFKIAEELLHAQHQFARRLLEAVQPAAEQAAEAAAGAADAAADAAQADENKGGAVKQAINKVRGDS